MDRKKQLEKELENRGAPARGDHQGGRGYSGTRCGFCCLGPELDAVEFLKRLGSPGSLERSGAIHFFEHVEPCFYICLKTKAWIVEEQMRLAVKVIRDLRRKDETIGSLSTMELYDLMVDIYSQAVELATC